VLVSPTIGGVEALKASFKYLPLIIGVVILAAIAALSPWDDISGLLRRLTLPELGVMAALSLAYYATKALRFWVMLRMLKIEVDMGTSTLAYMAAQPVTVLPAGELYRTVLLKRYGGVPIPDSSPTVTVQGLVEAVVLLTGAFMAAVTIGRSQGTVIFTGVLLFIVLLVLRRGWLKDKHEYFNKLPFVSFSRRYYNKFIVAHQRLLRPRFLAVLVALSVLPVGVGIVLQWYVAQALDVPVSWAIATMAYCLPTILSGVSFLPGGVGANEGSSIGLLRLAGLTSGAAVAITLVVRLFTLGAGVVFGLLGLGLASLLGKARHDKSATDQPESRTA
jgi:uncharacterized protein (TIRG00374 family)